MARVSKRSKTFFRLSPAEQINAQCFGVEQGKIRQRADVNFWRITPFLEERFSRALFPLLRFGELAVTVQYGCSELAKLEPLGVPILRMNNLQNDGWDLSNLKYIELTENQLGIYKLNVGDLIFNRTNSKELVGKCEVFRETGDWVFASYLIRVRTDEMRLNPQFASDFLSTFTGRLQIDRFSRQIIGMTNINAEEIRQILIPTPPLQRQIELVCAMDQARLQRKQKLAEADALLSSLDDYLINALGLDRPIKDERKVFAMRLQDIQLQGRLNSDYFHPERILALRAMTTAAQTINCQKLEDVVSFVRDKIKKPENNYLGLAHVQSNTGELTNVDDIATGDCFTFQNQDVLFARLRPYLNKVYRTEMDGCCSPEFHVLRIHDDNMLLPDYLAVILRSRLILAQTIHMMTGNTHPRLTNDDVINLLIPIPNIDLQENISSEVQRRRDEARRLRSEAETGWQSAKQWFEEQLLGVG